MNFDTIDYLNGGTDRQKEAYTLLIHHNIIEKLAGFSPVLTGTIPLNIDTAESDLDIICQYQKKDLFIEAVKQKFSAYQGFKITSKIIHEQQTVLANFCVDNFQIEIFGQNRPVKEQEAYRHMIIEYKILLQKGEEFRRRIIELKIEGLKTEPAFAKLLGLKGDAYEALLQYNSF